MPLKLYNTKNRKKEEFIPLHEGKVNFYACGPTVYDYFHIGNARPLIMFDALRRYLEYKGLDVNYIVNITDVDDKIIRRANEAGIDFKALTDKYTDAFFEGCEQLGVRPATEHPRATEFIGGMMELIERLIEKGNAYAVDGDVYFDIDSYKGYGKLSGRDVEQMRAGARVDVDSRKKNPLDFALWKSVKPDEPSWDSPWGKGRPGWHIECSVMGMHYAGDTLDIHAGGQDLIFPHHENEAAQSEAATGKTFARYWLHNGFLDIEGEKMSKSLGNFLMVKDIIKEYDPMAIRVFFMLKHYRSPIDFSRDRITEAKAALDRLRNAYAKITRVLGNISMISTAGISKVQPPSSLTHTFSNIEKITDLKSSMEEALDDDFNTARAIGCLFDIAKTVNSMDEQSADAPHVMVAAKDVFDTIGTAVFGITFEVQAGGDKIVDDLVQLLIKLRAEARADKNWALSDVIRDRLKEIGVVLEDRADGTSWKLA